MRSGRMTRWAACVGAVVFTIWGTAAGAITAAEKCAVAKRKIAGKYIFCRMTAEAKAIKKGEAPTFSTCDAKLRETWAKAEQKAIDKGSTCIDSVTDVAIQRFVTGYTDAVSEGLDGNDTVFTYAFPATGQTTAHGPGSDGDVRAGAALSYTDNGDGTITDNNTGLRWEKKDDSGGLHDKDNTYTWCADTSPMDSNCDAAGDPMDGTITTTLLHTLNDVGGGGANCFAGYCDWRVPNVKELLSIINFEVAFVAVAPAFQQPTCLGCTDVTLPSCSCTGSGIQFNYWSSTTEPAFPQLAWAVDFRLGTVFDASKIPGRYVRAVRGGL